MISSRIRPSDGRYTLVEVDWIDASGSLICPAYDRTTTDTAVEDHDPRNDQRTHDVDVWDVRVLP